MKAAAYFTVSLATFLSIAAMHLLSYRQEIMPRAFYFAALPTLLLCTPLVLLFLRLRRTGPAKDVWQRFWTAALMHCPRWIWGSMSIAWLLALLSFARTFFGQQFTESSFRTAWLLIPAGAALSYSVTLMRTPQNETA